MLEGTQTRYEIQVPTWPSRDRLWERYESAPLLVKLCVAHLLDRDVLPRFNPQEIPFSAESQLDVVIKVDKGRAVLRPTVVLH